MEGGEDIGTMGIREGEEDMEATDVWFPKGEEGREDIILFCKEGDVSVGL